MKIDMGFGEDVLVEVDAALISLFGDFDELKNVIVKRPDGWSKSRSRAYDREWVRDLEPAADVEASVWTTGYGFVRPDSLLGKFAAGDFETDINLSSLLWVLFSHEAMIAHFEAGRMGPALEAAARMGRHYQSALLSQNLEYVDTVKNWKRGGLEAARNIEDRNAWISKENSELTGSKRSRAAQLHEKLKNHLSDNSRLPWKLPSVDTIRTDILPLLKNR
jgi:hypothetical protein